MKYRYYRTCGKQESLSEVYMGNVSKDMRMSIGLREGGDIYDLKYRESLFNLCLSKKEDSVELYKSIPSILYDTTITICVSVQSYFR